MQYSALIEDIIERVDANLVTEYTARAKTLFLSAVAQLATAEEITEFDIPELVEKESLDLSGLASQLCEIKVLGSATDISGNGLLKIFDVYEKPNSDNSVVYTKQPLNYIKSISSNVEMQPDDNEIYYYKAGNYIVFYHPSLDFSAYTPEIIYVQSPSQWSDSDEMIEKYSQNFLQRASDATVKLLHNEITT